jgi:2-iminobutanoate/2-iminopropanoate deaminase
MSVTRNARQHFVLVATLLLVGCSYRLPGAMGPTKTPDEIRKTEGESSMYVLEKKPPPAPASRPDAALPSAARAAPSSAPGRAMRQAAVAPARGRQGDGEAPAAMRYGDLFFISGQLPTDVRGNPTAESRVEEHARLAMENVRAILEANQMTMANVISTTVYLKDLNDVAAFDKIYAQYFGGSLPSRSVVEVARLPNNAKVEISAVAGR